MRTEDPLAMLAFSVVSMLAPTRCSAAGDAAVNPQNLAAIGTDSSFNTAASFTTNTNWQSCS